MLNRLCLKVKNIFLCLHHFSFQQETVQHITTYNIRGFHIILSYFFGLYDRLQWRERQKAWVRFEPMTAAWGLYMGFMGRPLNQLSYWFFIVWIKEITD